jgi:hypothetical protein
MSASALVLCVPGKPTGIRHAQLARELYSLAKLACPTLKEL